MSTCRVLVHGSGTRIVSQVHDQLKKTKKNWKTICVYIHSHLLARPTVSDDTMFIVRIVELFKIAINRRLHLFIFFTTEPFIQVWKQSEAEKSVV